MYIAIRTDDGRNIGKISFYCSTLQVSRQAFYDYLERKGKPWKYQPLADAMLKIHDEDEESTLIEQVEMWQCLLNAELETHLPMLNGYSRMEYEKKTGTNAFSIMLFDESRLDKDIKRDTGLQKLPLKTQEMIYRAFFENIIGKDRIKTIC